MIADRLLKARLMAGLTQKSLADATQIPLSLIREWKGHSFIETTLDDSANVRIKH